MIEENQKKEDEECAHHWGELQTAIDDTGSMSDSIDFYYQRCDKCGIIRKI